MYYQIKHGSCNISPVSWCLQLHSCLLVHVTGIIFILNMKYRIYLKTSSFKQKNLLLDSK